MSQPGPNAPIQIPDAGRRIACPERAIRAELDRILHSPAFSGSRRSQHFLQYVVEKTLESQMTALKERNLAIDLFGRPPSANLSEDTIVRVSAREVRRRLQQFYASAEGARAQVQIRLPAGTYVPEFLPPETPQGHRHRPDACSTGLAAASAQGSRLPACGVWAAVFLAIAGALALASRLTPDGGTEAALAEWFWQPLLSPHSEVLIGLPHPIVYQPSARALRESARRQPPQEIPLQRPLALRPEELSGADFFPVDDQYAVLGDLFAVSHLHAMLSLRNRAVRMRVSSRMEPGDLKESPSIQIGAYSNPWTLELGRTLRFRFGYMPDGRPCIADSSKPGRHWALPMLSRHMPADQDYILVSRLLSSPWGQPAVLVAGLDQFGTGAGGQLLSDPRRLGVVLHSIGTADWRRANLQMVLQIRVVGSTASAPQLVAWHVW